MRNSSDVQHDLRNAEQQAANCRRQHDRCAKSSGYKEALSWFDQATRHDANALNYRVELAQIGRFSG